VTAAASVFSTSCPQVLFVAKKKQTVCMLTNAMPTAVASLEDPNPSVPAAVVPSLLSVTVPILAMEWELVLQTWFQMEIAVERTKINVTLLTSV